MGGRLRREDRRRSRSSGNAVKKSRRERAMKIETEAGARSERAASEARAAAQALQGIEALDAVVLFGSVQRGEARADSDVDVAVLGSDEACREAGRRLPERLAGLQVQVIALSRETAYGEAHLWGSLGREVVETGQALLGGDRTEEIRKEGAEPYTAEDVAEQCTVNLELAETAVSKWSAYRKEGSPGTGRMAAKAVSYAGEMVMKEAATLRGWVVGFGHDLKKVRAKTIGRGERPQVIASSDAETATLLERMAARMNGEGEKMNEMPYRLRKHGGGVDESQVEERLGHMLRYLHEERQAVMGVPGMEAVEGLTAPASGRLAEAVRSTPGVGRSQTLQTGLMAWGWTPEEEQKRARAERQSQRSSAGRGER